MLLLRLFAAVSPIKKSPRQRAVVWEDWLDPCVAMEYLWHEHKETTSCVDEEKTRWRAPVESLSMPTKVKAGTYEAPTIERK